MTEVIEKFLARTHDGRAGLHNAAHKSVEASATDPLHELSRQLIAQHESFRRTERERAVRVEELALSIGAQKRRVIELEDALVCAEARAEEAILEHTALTQGVLQDAEAERVFVSRTSRSMLAANAESLHRFAGT